MLVSTQGALCMRRIAATKQTFGNASTFSVQDVQQKSDIRKKSNDVEITKKLTELTKKLDLSHL